MLQEIQRVSNWINDETSEKVCLNLKPKMEEIVILIGKLLELEPNNLRYHAAVLNIEKQ